MKSKHGIPVKRCHPDDFVAMALLVLGPDVNRYSDPLVVITRDVRKGLELEITRQPMNIEGSDFLSVDNPVTMVYNGKVIRHHGEHVYITYHLEKLVEAITGSPYLYIKKQEVYDD